MRRLSLVPLVLFLTFPLAGQAPDPHASHIAPTSPLSPAEEVKKFRLPPGFEAQLVASEPDIYKPMNLAFDDRGRLWVTSSIEYPFPPKDGQKSRDRVTILEDFGPDGRARKVTQFASDLNIPIGLLPLPGGGHEALAFSIPQILRLRDTNDDGRADERATFLGTFGQMDTHGLTSGFSQHFDGWIYACHGFNNTSNLRAADGSAITLHSGNTYRIPPDGSRIEWFTHGQVNPFGMALDPRGYLYTADCHSQPIYQLIRDGYYPSFGKPHDGLGFAPEMTTEDHGGTGIAGIAYYAADQFPLAYRDTVFIGNVITCRVNHDTIAWHGSSPRAKRGPDFLVSDDPWFRPVDLKLGPDGALYIADFYNRIIGHYEVPLTHPKRDRDRGRIWRIVYKGEGAKEAKAPRADWTRAAVPELIDDLHHPNLTVRMTATHELVRRGGDDVVTAVQQRLANRGNPSPLSAAHGLWVLERLGKLDATTLESAVKSSDALVRLHAIRILGERGKLSEAESSQARAALGDADPHVRRAAADALARHPNARDFAPLLQLLRATPAEDTHLRYVVRMALRNQLRVPDAWSQLSRLDAADRPAILEIALGVATAESAAFVDRQLGSLTDRGLRARCVQHVARHGKEIAGKELLARATANAPHDLGYQAELLRAVQRGTQERGVPLSKEAQAWAADLCGALLRGKTADDSRIGLELIGQLQLKQYQLDTQVYAASSSAPEPVRHAALSALSALDPRRNAATLGKVLTDADAPAGLRDHCANLLGQANQPETRAELVKALPVTPARHQTVIAAALAGSRPGAEQLVEAMLAGKASARLLSERSVLTRLERSLPDLKKRTEKLVADPAFQRAGQQLQTALERRRQGFLTAKGDPVLGRAVFEKQCAICHQLGGKGAKVGPQLDGIGLRGLDRLLEDTLDPSRNVDQAFRTSVVNLKNGKVLGGLLLLREDGAVLVFADEKGQEQRIAKDDIEERAVVPQSPMPANLVDQIPEADFNHLLAFLLSQRPAQ